MLNNSKKDILTLCQEPLKQGGRVLGQNLQHLTLNFDLLLVTCSTERRKEEDYDEEVEEDLQDEVRGSIKS